MPRPITGRRAQRMTECLVILALLLNGCDEPGAAEPATVSEVGGCHTSTTAFSSLQFANQTGTFTASFDATPLQAAIDGVVGVSSSAVTGYTGLAAIVRFSQSSVIEARDGGDYGAASEIPYTANITYHFRLAINPAAHTYSAYVTPHGGSELTIGTGYGFRSEQATASRLGHANFIAAVGSLSLCNFSVTPAGGSHGTMQLTGDFESGNLSPWRFDGSARSSVITSPVHDGSYAVRMVAGPGGNPIYRTELVADEQGYLNDGVEYWIGASVRLETAFPSWGTLLQTHGIPHDEQWQCSAGKNPITVVAAGDRIALNVISEQDKVDWQDGSAVGNREVWSQTVTRGKWYSWVFRFRQSTGADGIIEAWVNGTKIFTHRGGNRVTRDACGEPVEPSTYLKIGIYRDGDDQSTQTIEYDDVRIFKGTNGYDQVAR